MSLTKMDAFKVRLGFAERGGLLRSRAHLPLQGDKFGRWLGNRLSSGTSSHCSKGTATVPPLCRRGANSQLVFAKLA